MYDINFGEIYSKDFYKKGAFALIHYFVEKRAVICARNFSFEIYGQEANR